jgi:hypothetical protein
MLNDFSDGYIERCDKETEEVLGEETAKFLEESITYLKTHKNEFIYLESSLFEALGVDAVSLEMDDVFGNYDVMLGIKLQKKYESSIKEYLHNTLSGDGEKFDLMFNQGDGLWDLNFSLNNAEGYKEGMSFAEAYGLIYTFLDKMATEVKKK